MPTTTSTDCSRPARTTITADCLSCGNVKQFTGNARTWSRWKNHEVSSDTAFRNLVPSDRVWLLSGLCPECISPATTSAEKPAVQGRAA